MEIPVWHFRKIGTTQTWRSIVLQPRRTGKVFRLASISRLSDFKVMMSLYFFTGIFFTLSLNAFFTQLANDFVAGVLSIVGGVISSVVVAWCKRRWEQHWCGWGGRDSLPLLIVYNAASLCYEFCLFYGLSGTLDDGIRIWYGDIFKCPIV